MEREALIFDCDGTLTDSMPAHFVSWRTTLGRHGIEFPEDRFYQLAGTPTDKIVALLSEEQGVQVDLDQVVREKQEEFLRSVHLVRPIPAVVEEVHRQRNRLKLAVASGGWRRVVLGQLETIGLLDAFDAIVTAEDTERHKPHPDVFLEAARRLQVAPAACLVYEDSDLGLEAARRAGMQSVDIREFHTPQMVGEAGTGDRQH